MNLNDHDRFNLLNALHYLRDANCSMEGARLHLHVESPDTFYAEMSHAIRLRQEGIDLYINLLQERIKEYDRESKIKDLHGSSEHHKTLEAPTGGCDGDKTLPDGVEQQAHGTGKEKKESLKSYARRFLPCSICAWWPGSSEYKKGGEGG